jgi:hypothetical protein
MSALEPNRPFMMISPPTSPSQSQTPPRSKETTGKKNTKAIAKIAKGPVAVMKAKAPRKDKSPAKVTKTVINWHHSYISLSHMF